MSYKIGNTVVIDNNAALGSVDGNSLNLANNSNISGGGSASLYTTTTPGATAAVGSNVTLAFVVGGGGAGAFQGPNVTRTNAKRMSSGGAGGSTGIHAFDSSNTPSLDVVIGAAGTISATSTGNPGGTSSIDSTNIHFFAGMGGKGNTLTPNIAPAANTNRVGSQNLHYTFEATPSGETYTGTNPFNSSSGLPTSWQGQATSFGHNTNQNVGIAGAPSALVRSQGNLGNPALLNHYGKGGSSMFSSANNQTGAPNYVPGNNFGFGQAGVGFATNSLYVNTPGNMDAPNLSVDSNVSATPGCVLLLGF